MNCHASIDGDCTWSECPQLHDGEPVKSGRHCPLDIEVNRCTVTVAQGCQDDYFGGTYCKQDCAKLMKEVKDELDNRYNPGSKVQDRRQR